jgi:hypothetical protein
MGGGTCWAKLRNRRIATGGIEMIPDKNRVYDGWMSLEGGVDAGRVSTLLDPNQCVSAENMVFRGGHPAPRPGIRLLAENFANPNHSYYDAPVYDSTGKLIHQTGDDAGQNTDGTDKQIQGQEASTIYKTGNFQAAIGFSPHHGDDSIMAMIGGRLFRIIPGAQSTARVTEIALDKRNTYRRQIAYMLQADKWLIAQDGQSLPIIYDGNKARRSIVTNDANKTEVPVGTIMSYGMGRICVVVNKRDVAFGDLFGSHDFDDPADSLILFTERNFLTEGFDAAIPFSMGVPTGMAFFPQLDTSTGNGQLLVFAERGAAAFFLSLDRTLWKTSLFQILALITTGMRGHRSVCAVNEDLWFRAEDGFRNFRQARSESQGWAHIPNSTNVRQFLDVDTQWLLKYASAIYFDNRIIGTCSPSWNQMRPVHAGLVVVDFDILSSFGQRYKPCWDGHWQKQRPLGNPYVQVSQLLTASFSGLTRAFFFGLDANGQNQLYELTLDDKDDYDGLVEWEMVSRSLTFAQQGETYNENELYDGDIWLRDIQE